MLYLFLPTQKLGKKKLYGKLRVASKTKIVCVANKKLLRISKVVYKIKIRIFDGG